MARLHRRGYSNGNRAVLDWTIDFTYSRSAPLVSGAVPPMEDCVLSLRLLDGRLAEQIAEIRSWCTVKWTPDGWLALRGIAITAAEASAIANGADPVELLLNSGWTGGYRLVAVPDRLG